MIRRMFDVVNQAFLLFEILFVLIGMTTAGFLLGWGIVISVLDHITIPASVQWAISISTGGLFGVWSIVRAFDKAREA